jgi:RNA polymerase sigma factor (sigma-70 family)
MAVASVLQFLREHVARAELETTTDAQLLKRFIADRDDAAFTTLLCRHSTMVWGVCKRMLGQDQDAEEAFQATFVVLIRKAASIHPPSMVGNWLYGVAHQISLKARAMNAKRMSREKQLIGPLANAEAKHDPWLELQSILDQELSLLPEKYRVTIVLCDLEGKTRKEAAAHLDVPEGTVAGRLARARAMLAKRLVRHGFAVTGATLASFFAQSCVSASAPASVVASTIKSASQLAAGGVISAKVTILAEGVVKAMFLSKLKLAIAVVLVLGTAALGLGVLARGEADARHKDARQPVVQDKDAGPVIQPDPARKEPAQQRLDKTERERLVGTWIIINDDSLRKGEKWIISEDRIRMAVNLVGGNDNFLRFHRLDPSKDPKQIDITIMKQPDGQPLAVVKGIYVLDGDELRLCLGVKDRPQVFPKKPGPGEVLLLKRAFTPEEVIKNKLEGEICVKFHVAKASRPSGLQATPGESFPVLLAPALNQTSKDQFYAVVSGKAVLQLKGNGVTDPYAHLRDKTVRVTGKVRRVAHDTGAYYELLVESAERIELQKQDAAPGATIGRLKAEARGRLIHKGTDFRLVVHQDRAPDIELLIRTEADSSPLNKTLLRLKDTEVTVTGNVAWFPKGAQINSDDDYALGIVFREEGQIQPCDTKEAPAHYLKVEAKGVVVSKDDDAYHLFVRLQKKPAKMLRLSFWIDRPHPLLRKLHALKDREAIISGKLRWEPKSTSDFGFTGPAFEVTPADAELQKKEAAQPQKEAGPTIEVPWGETVEGWRLRVTMPSGTEYRRNKPMPLLLELQNDSKGPLPLGPLAWYVDPEVTENGKRLVARPLIDVSPWEGRRDEVPAGASVKWTVDFDRIRFSKQPLKAGTALQVRFRARMQDEGPKGKPLAGPQRLLLSNEVSLKLKDDHPSIMAGQADLAPKWTDTTELVYREYVPLGVKSGFALRIDGTGRVWLMSAGEKGQAGPGGLVRTEVVLNRDRLDRLAEFLRDNKVWELADLPAEIAAIDGGEIRLSIGSGHGSLVRTFPDSMFRKQPTLLTLQREMEDVKATVLRQAAANEAELQKKDRQ